MTKFTLKFSGTERSLCCWFVAFAVILQQKQKQMLMPLTLLKLLGWHLKSEFKTCSFKTIWRKQ